jgi:hypothetical protein
VSILSTSKRSSDKVRKHFPSRLPSSFFIAF